MKTTIPKLRRIIRQTLAESLNANGLDQNHLDGLADWVSINSENGMEQNYDETIRTYIEACADDGEVVSYEFVERHLDHIIDKHPSIVDEGGFVLDLETRDDIDSEEQY